MMMRRGLFLVLAAGALLLLPFADCMSAMTQDQQSMQCCTSMPCAPAIHIQGCCKPVTSPQTQSIVITARASLHAPVFVDLGYAQTFDIARSAPVPLEKVEARQQSPPDLYTLHASLLI
jgi:hypothetical protein